MRDVPGQGSDPRGNPANRGGLLAPAGPRLMRRVALATVVANVGIVLTGGAVRLTQSGLGCPTWPQCTGASLVPVHRPGIPALNMAIEFGNRLLTFVVLAVAVLCLVVALRLAPRRRDLIRLAALQPVGVIAQAVLGGITVLTQLHPATVAAHFLVSMGLVAAAVALHARAREADEPPRPTVRSELRLLAWALVGVTGVVLVLGTVVTGAGPHGGDASSPRFDLPIELVAQVHADAVWVLLGLTFALLLALRLTGAPAAVTRRAVELLVLELAQGAIGYVQYFLGVPPVLVALHMLGATLVWIAAWRVVFATRDRGPVARPSAVAEDAALVR